MYVTRHLSSYRKDPNLLSSPPPSTEGPYTGFLVITDEETEAEDVCCFGLCKQTLVKEFPFPQNKILNVVYTTGAGENQHQERDKVMFIPVLDQPLGLNRYYAVRAQGKYRGLTCKCSTEEDMTTCCFCNCIKDVKPDFLNPRDIYQQVEIFRKRVGFYAKSISPDGFPPSFLRRKGWSVHISSSFECQLNEASGLNKSLRMQLPGLSLQSSSSKHSVANVVGKWYVPFMFVREKEPLKDQMKNSMFYEMSLEQYWEEISSCENGDEKNQGNKVEVNVKVQKEVVSLFGEEVVKGEKQGVDGFIWYRHVDHNDTQELGFGLSVAIVEKMRKVQELGGWIEGGGSDEMIERVEKFGGGDSWKTLRCFVLVERFSLRRMDGTLVLTNVFRHVQHVQSKWE